MAKHTENDMAYDLHLSEYDFEFTLFDFRIDSILNKPLYMTLLLIYGIKCKYKSLYDNTLQ